jgi:hypothetical protein
MIGRGMERKVIDSEECDAFVESSGVDAIDRKYNLERCISTKEASKLSWDIADTYVPGQTDLLTAMLMPVLILVTVVMLNELLVLLMLATVSEMMMILFLCWWRCCC